MDNLLSIVIPSHNKTHLLISAIDSILLENNINEICVSDNSESSETQESVKNNYSTNNKIKYRRSLDSPSLDENVNTAINMSSSKYVWIFGDDDLIIKDASESIYNVLSGEKYDIVIINSQTFSEDIIIEQKRHFLERDKKYSESDNDEFLVDMGGYMTYVPSIIIKRELWVNSYDQDNNGTFFAHLATVLKAKKNNRAYFLSEPIIKMRLYSQTWTEYHFMIWSIHFPSIIWAAKGYSIAAKNSVVKEFPLMSVLPVLSSRAYGKYNISIFLNIVLSTDKCNIPYKIIHFLIAIIPRLFLTKLYYYLIKFGIKKRSMNFSPELALEQLKD